MANISVNVASDKVKVFPFGSNRNSYQENNRVLNEENITNLVRSLSDVSNYVLRYDSSQIEFVIAGYYFSITLPSLEQFKDTKDVYAYILVKESMLYGGDTEDDNSVFTGLTLTDTLPDNNEFYLHLLTFNEDRWEVPNASFERFEYTHVKGLDGKVQDIDTNLKNTVNTAIQNLQSLLELKAIPTNT